MHLALLKPPTLAALAILTFIGAARADENFFGWARNAETLPKGNWDTIHTFTYREGVDRGVYRAFDYEPEIEYGATDALQLSASLEGSEYTFKDNGFANRLNTGYGETNDGFLFRGGMLAAKYNILSPFMESFGLAVRGSIGYTAFSEGASIEQSEIAYTFDVILHKNFLDNTLITVLNLVGRQTSGKRPAAEFDTELAAHLRAGVMYRLVDNWYLGAEGRLIAEYPHNVNTGNYEHEHHVLYLGPTLHFAQEKYWITLTCQWQTYGRGDNEPVSNRTYAGEQAFQTRLKVGYNF